MKFTIKFWYATIVGLALLATGCSSDDPNRVGSELVNDQFDVVLFPLGVEDFARSSVLEIDDTKIPVPSQQVMYLGTRNGTISAMLVNFDFDDVFNEDFPESLFVESKIKTVKLSLTKLKFYGSSAKAAASIIYGVHQLDTPFDPAGYPGPIPDYDPVNLNADPFEPQGNLPNIAIYKDDFLGWVDEGGTRGFVIMAAAGSDSGLVGFGSLELVRYSEIPDVAVGTVVAPNFVVDFNDEQVNFLLEPYEDTSTFNQIGPPPLDPADGILIRTCLRSYPALLFDFDELPPNVFINRAILQMTNDTTTAFGPLEAIVVSEMDTVKFGIPPQGMTLATLQQSVYEISGQTSLDPASLTRVGFDVTTAVQRIVNNVYEGTRGLVLTAGEDFFPFYDFSATDPDFYFREFRFMGTSAAVDSLRPQLKITYSGVDELIGETP